VERGRAAACPLGPVDVAESSRCTEIACCTPASLISSASSRPASCNASGVRAGEAGTSDRHGEESEYRVTSRPGRAGTKR
jgi:hypothetical protein